MKLKNYNIIHLSAILPIAVLILLSCGKKPQPATGNCTYRLLINNFTTSSSCFPPSQFFADMEVFTVSGTTLTRSSTYSQLNIPAAAFGSFGSTITMPNLTLPCSGQFVIKFRLEDKNCKSKLNCCSDCPVEGKPVYSFTSQVLTGSGVTTSKDLDIILVKDFCRCC